MSAFFGREQAVRQNAFDLGMRFEHPQPPQELIVRDEVFVGIHLDEVVASRPPQADELRALRYDLRVFENHGAVARRDLTRRVA